MLNKDKYSTYFDFEHRIRSGNIDPVYFILAEDTYFLNKACDLLKEKLTGSKLNNENYFIKYADETSIEEILNLSSNFSSLFAQKKIIIVKKCEKFKKFDDFLSYCKNPDFDTTLLLAFNKDYVNEKKLYNTFDFYDFTNLPDNEYFEWLKSEFKNYGCIIDEETLEMFSDYVPRVFDLVVNEIKKVSDYLGNLDEKKVTKEIIRKLSGYETEYTPIELIGYLVTGDCRNALKVIDYLLYKESTNEVYLLTIMTNLFLDLMAIKGESIQYMQNREFYLNYKIWGDRINFVKKHQNDAKNLNFNKIFEKLIETDQKLKTSMIDPKVLLISLIQELTSPSQAD